MYPSKKDAEHVTYQGYSDLCMEVVLHMIYNDVIKFFAFLGNDGQNKEASNIKVFFKESLNFIRDIVYKKENLPS